MISVLLVLQLLFNDMSSQSDIACFSLNPYKEYCGRMLEFNHKQENIELTLEVDPATWESADLLMMFNLDWDKRNPGTISGTKPVQISMFLDHNLYKELRDSGKLLTDKAAFLASDKDHPMRNQSAWFATEATEEVDLPEELKAKGSVRQGFTTQWKEN